MDRFVKVLMKSSVAWLVIGITLKIVMATYPPWMISRPAQLPMNVAGFGGWVIQSGVCESTTYRRCEDSERRGGVPSPRSSASGAVRTAIPVRGAMPSGADLTVRWGRPRPRSLRVVAGRVGAMPQEAVGASADGRAARGAPPARSRHLPFRACQ